MSDTDSDYNKNVSKKFIQLIKTIYYIDCTMDCAIILFVFNLNYYIEQ